MTDPDIDLRDYLLTRDVPCPECAYNLRGLVGGVCPECKELLQLRVCGAEPPLGPLMGAVAGLMLGAGAAAAVVVVVSIGWISSDGGVGGEVRVAWAGALFIALFEGGIVWRVLSRRGRRQFAEIPPVGRHVMVMACWGLSILLGLIYGVVLSILS